MTRSLWAWLSAIFLYSCSPSSENTQATLPTGVWRATLQFQEEALPFNFELEEDSSGQYNIVIINARERLLLDEVFVRGDSVNIPLHIFDASFRTVWRDGKLSGTFIKHYDPANPIPFQAVPGQHFRFESSRAGSPSTDFSGKYRVQFFNPTDTTEAVGVFLQRNDSVTGTFLTPTGDYRYLQGNVIEDTMHLSAFDGNHAYLFKAHASGRDSLDGVFYSGRTQKKAWRAVRDDQASLPDAERLTYLKPGFERVEFAFPDPDGDTVSLRDDKYQDKVVILQIFGTWCPNCMDETRFLGPWYEQNKDRGVEIIGLAYERKDDFGYASKRVKRMIEKLDVTYDFVIAGTSDKKKASETLPMLNAVVSFPTTIFIGKDGKVKKIHTGFTGPGTGEYYEQYIEEFNETVNNLLL
jgi:thiol-disulfide isomerase/thioredoxin